MDKFEEEAFNPATFEKPASEVCRLNEPKGLVEGCLAGVQQVMGEGGDLGAGGTAVGLATWAGVKAIKKGVAPLQPVLEVIGAEAGLGCAAGVINTLEDNYNNCLNNKPADITQDSVLNMPPVTDTAVPPVTAPTFSPADLPPETGIISPKLDITPRVPNNVMESLFPPPEDHIKLMGEQ